MPVILLALRYLLLVVLYIFIFRVVYLLTKEMHIKGRQEEHRKSEGIKKVKEIVGFGLVALGSGVPEIKAGDQWELGKLVTIGRKTENDLIIEDTYTSHYHAKIYWLNGNYWLEDLGSTNGTFVNGYRINQATMLIDHDQIKIGSVSFRFVRWEHAVQ